MSDKKQKRTIVPVVFSFNDTFIIPAMVCLTSLLENANDGTDYEISILHSGKRLSGENKKLVTRLAMNYSNCKINFIDLNDRFMQTFEVRNISIDTYYRLAIPDYFTSHKRIIYADVDMIFLNDLSPLMTLKMGNHSVAAVADIVISNNYKKHYGFGYDSYFNAGFLVMNLDKINRMGDYHEKLRPLLNKNFYYQDQDILNLLYKDDVFFLDQEYNFSPNHLDIKNVKNKDISVVHFVGKKPWNCMLPLGDLWWEYFRKSPVYEAERYLNFQRKEFKLLNAIRRVLSFFTIEKYTSRIRSNFLRPKIDNSEK